LKEVILRAAPKLFLDGGIGSNLVSFEFEVVLTPQEIIEQDHKWLNTIRNFREHNAFEIARLLQLG
tara:strand:- start:24085 stop:24282 length:198 start_codon:yes stop_codon:yes gene_type:complete